MCINYYDPTKTTGTDGYINYKLSGAGSGGGGNRGSRGLGCGGLIIIILIVLAFINDLVKRISGGVMQFFYILA